MNLRYPALGLAVLAVGAVGMTAMRSPASSGAPEVAVATSVVSSGPADDWPDEGTGYPGYGQTEGCR